jgi:aryl-alcohol dehydrogenase-like predicted oxidoreductase
VASEEIDFVQLNYSVAEREAERRLLPLAAEKRLAVLINRPFAGGPLFRKVLGKPLPGWAKEIGCATWAQFFLKFVISHPAVTCAIPATSKVAHLTDNMQAGAGKIRRNARGHGEIYRGTVGAAEKPARATQDYWKRMIF